MGQGRGEEKKDGVVQDKRRTPWVPPPCHGWRLPWAQSSSPESKTKSQLHKAALIQCYGAMGSFKLVTLVGYLHGNSSHPKLLLPVWEETFQKWGKAEVSSGFSLLWPFSFGKSCPFPKHHSLLRKLSTEEEVSGTLFASGCPGHILQSRSLKLPFL